MSLYADYMPKNVSVLVLNPRARHQTHGWLLACLQGGAADADDGGVQHWPSAHVALLLMWHISAVVSVVTLTRVDTIKCVPQ